MLNDFLLSPGSIKERQDRVCSLQSRFLLAIRASRGLSSEEEI